jgi:hypothetical protein
MKIKTYVKEFKTVEGSYNEMVGYLHAELINPKQTTLDFLNENKNVKKEHAIYKLLYLLRGQPNKDNYEYLKCVQFSDDYFKIFYEKKP